MQKKSSIDRIFTQFKDYPINTISQIQALNKRNDSDKIKQLLNKPNISNSTAMAYSRLANQYVRLLSEIKEKDVKRLNNKYQINLEPQNFNVNIDETSKKFVKPKAIKPTPFSIDKSTQYGGLPNYKDFITLSNITFIELRNYLSVVQLTANFTMIRLVLVLNAINTNTKKLEKIIVSSKEVYLNSIENIFDFMDSVEDMINTEGYLYYHEGIRYLIKGINKAIICLFN